MVNVLLWVIGVVCNYNTKTRRVNGFLFGVDPTEVMVGFASAFLVNVQYNQLHDMDSDVGAVGSVTGGRRIRCRPGVRARYHPGGGGWRHTRVRLRRMANILVA